MPIKISTNLFKELNQIILEDLLAICEAKLPWEKLNGKTVLITGGGGFLASYLVQALFVIKRLYGLNFRVECVVRNKESAIVKYKAWAQESNFNIFQHDISKPLTNDFPRGDFIIHCASQASPKFYGTDPTGTLRANSVGTMYLLDHAVKCSSEKFLFFSSGEVYGCPVDSNQLIGEDSYGYLDSMNLRSCYAESKRIGETMCVAWAEQYKVDVSVVRPFHTYGPGMALDDGRVFSDFVSDVVARRDIKVKSNGLALRPFCYISDATVGFLTVLLSGAPAQAYNVANPYAEISMRDLAYSLVQIFPDLGLEVKFELQNSGKGYLQSPVNRQRPNIQKISELGWHPKIAVLDGFTRTIKSYFS